MDTAPIVIQLSEITRKGEGRSFIGWRSILDRFFSRLMGFIDWWWPKNKNITTPVKRFAFTWDGEFKEIETLPEKICLFIESYEDQGQKTGHIVARM